MKILHDIHTHNVLSSCCEDPTATTENYVKKELELGMRTFGLSNHVWDESIKGALNWYSFQTIKKARESETVMRYMPHEGLRCLFGVETEYYGCYDKLGISLEGAKSFDYVLVPFSHIHMRGFVMAEYPEIGEMRKELLAKAKAAWRFLDEKDIENIFNYMNYRTVMKYIPELTTDVADFAVRTVVGNFRSLLANEDFRRLCGTVPTSIAHPFNYCGFGEEEKSRFLTLVDDETVRECFAEAKRLGAYIEINVSAVLEAGEELEKNNMLRYFRIAKEEGCQFTFGTDSHATSTLEVIRRGDEIAALLGLTRNDIAEFVRDSVEE